MATTWTLAVTANLWPRSPVGGHDKPVTVYDTRSGKQIAVLATYSSSSPLMTFSNDNRLLAYHHHGTPGVQIYEIATGQPLVPEPRMFMSFLGFDPPAQRAVVLDEQGKIRVFKTADWSAVSELPGIVDPGDTRRRGAVSPDGKLLAVGSFEADPMRIYDLPSSKLLKEIPEPTTAASVLFSDTGDSLTTMSRDGVIVNYSAPDWRKVGETRDVRQERGGLASIAWTVGC